MQPELSVLTIVDRQTTGSVKAAKTRLRNSSIQYRDRPRIALIVQSFNRRANIDQIKAGLRLVNKHQLVVCDDGSIDGSREKWATQLDRPNDFLILSNDLHEIRILDRAIRFAASDYVCIVQDDDAIPRDTTWLDTALEQFEKHPKLAILGGFMGFLNYYRDPKEGRKNAIWEEAPFQFVAHVNIGPYFIRKLHFEKLGGWDFSLSKVGEPGIGFDSELRSGLGRRL